VYALYYIILCIVKYFVLLEGRKIIIKANKNVSLLPTNLNNQLVNAHIDFIQQLFLGTSWRSFK
jgi:hypothetical protein